MRVRIPSNSEQTPKDFAATLLARLRSLHPVARVVATVAINAALLGGIGYSFWYADWQYSFPTPRPEGLIQQPIGSRPELPLQVAALTHKDRAVVLNFANPQCACTEFNLEHVRKLQEKFGKTVDFVTIFETNAADENAQEEFQAMHLDMPVVYDQKGVVSEALGVYGTPQAAVLDRNGQIFYRGNFNKSRYCVDESSEYVRLALDALVAGLPAPLMPKEATITYGCPLPHPFRATESKVSKL
ncbi:MAG: redoxin family protein [Bryobacteraceae bacterium]